MAMPIFGSLFYVFVRIQPQKGKINKRLNFIIDQTKPYLVQKNFIGDNDDLIGFSTYMNNYAGYYLYEYSWAEVRNAQLYEMWGKKKRI